MPDRSAQRRSQQAPDNGQSDVDNDSRLDAPHENEGGIWVRCRGCGAFVELTAVEPNRSVDREQPS